MSPNIAALICLIAVWQFTPRGVAIFLSCVIAIAWLMHRARRKRRSDRYEGDSGSGSDLFDDADGGGGDGGD